MRTPRPLGAGASDYSLLMPGEVNGAIMLGPPVATCVNSALLVVTARGRPFNDFAEFAHYCCLSFKRLARMELPGRAFPFFFFFDGGKDGIKAAGLTAHSSSTLTAGCGLFGVTDCYCSLVYMSRRSAVYCLARAA